MSNTYLMSTSKYQAVSDILKAAQSQINALLSEPEDELHRLQINQVLQQQADRLLLITGTGDLSAQQTTTLGPAKTIGGKPIGKVRRFTEEDLVPSDDKVFNLKQQVEAAVLYFGPNASSEGILSNIPELIIRGVAKKAGLQVTKDEPKELTVEFIDQVKAALLAKGLVASKEEVEFVAEGLQFVKDLTAAVKDVQQALETKTDQVQQPATETPVITSAPAETAPEVKLEPEQSKADTKKKPAGK